MLKNKKGFSRPFRGCWLVLVILFGFVAPRLRAIDIQLPSLRIGADVYTNVTVYQMTETDIFVRHAQGFGNAKISSLDDDALVLLGLRTPTPKVEIVEGDTQSLMVMDKLTTAAASVNLTLPYESVLKEQMAQVKVTPQLLYGILGGLVIGYFFYCLCLQKVCVNAGSEPGLLVWFPLLQIFPLLRAAQMPVWWIVIFCVPILNILAHLLWCTRIVNACGKGFFTGLMLFLPVTNILALLYLAFSGGGERPIGKPFRSENLPGLAGA